VLTFLEQGKVVLFAAGTGLPYFSTDTTASLRACEIHADAVLCAKNIDGVYDSDPKVNPNAVKFDFLTYAEVLEKDLNALDQTAIAMCREYNLPIVVFENCDNAILDVVCGKKVGTIIK
ncbi:MAG: UMP kinase, partial [Clostridia bacterium]|nr:UMP kinase [Clostridia bacterium]